jgi:uncharacterized membrane protein YedE/YeeE
MSATTHVTGGARAASARAPTAARYMNPYLAGVGIGIVLLLAFVVMGRGLGATGAFGSVVSALVAALAPEHVAGNPVYERYLEDPPATSWLLYLVAGAFVGALLSAWAAGRLRGRIERGPRLDVATRLALAFGGGALAAIGAKLAKGCTSGQALTGGAQLNVGAWIFMLAVFAGAYALAWFVRRMWR